MLALMWVLAVPACRPESAPLPASDYASAILGVWQGTVGDDRETMSLAADGTFVCDLHRTGFIANTLSMGTPGRVRGTWRIAGRGITLELSADRHERPKNVVASGEILSLRSDTLVLRSAHGETATFRRVRAL